VGIVLSISKNNYTVEHHMNYTAKVAALASVIANVAPEHKLTRMRDNVLHTAYEIRMFEWWIGKLQIRPEGSKVTLTYPPKVGRWSPQRLDAWATTLIEGAMEMLTGGPFEIDYRVGVIEFERPGCTSYAI
jgi:hypothetical protein